MKIRTLFVSGLAALTLAACSKTETPGGGGGDDGEVASITIKLSEGVEGKAAAVNKVNDGDAIQFSEGYLFFVQNKIITKRVQIVTGTSQGTTNAAGDEIIGYANLQSGVSFNDVPKSSDRVVFVGNTPSSVTVPPVATDVDGFLAKTIDIATQANTADGDVSKVSIYGGGSIVPVTGQAYDAYAEFTIYPIVSRAQIEMVSVGEEEADYAGDETNNPIVLTGFKVTGIFVNYFLPDANLKGETDPSDLITYSQVSNWIPQTDPATTGHENYYSLAYAGVLYDYNTASGLGQFNTVSGEYTPNSGYDAWAYNIFADQVPHIIVRFDDIEYVEWDGTSAYVAGTAPLGTKYLTIKGFSDSFGVDVASFLKGYAYTIEDIPVKYSYLTDTPEEEESINVQVKINVMNWREQVITPNLP